MRVSEEDRAAGWTLGELKRFRDERSSLLCLRLKETNRLRQQLMELYGWVIAPKDPLKPETVKAYKLVLAAHGCPLEDGPATAEPPPEFDPSI